MAQIDLYSERVPVSGQPDGTRATADAFGMPQAQALGGVAQALTQVSAQYARVQDDQAKITAANQMADQFVQMKQAYDQERNGLDVSAPDFLQRQQALSEKYQQQWQQGTQTMLQNAPDRYTSKYIGMHSATYGRQFASYLIGQTADGAAVYTGQQMVDLAKRTTDIVAASPDNDTYQSTLDSYRQTVNGLNTISPEAKLKLIDAQEKQLSLTQVSVARARNPQAFLAAVGAQGGLVRPNGSVKGQVPGGAGPSVDAIMPVLWGQESGGNQFGADGTVLTSPKGAMGVGQIMPGTAPIAAKLAGLPYDADRVKTDPAYNKALSTAYFNAQMRTFGGDVQKALAAYNMGPGDAAKGTGVAGLVAKYGDNWLQHAPSETQNYVSSISGKLGLSTASLPGAGLPAVQPITDDVIAAAKPNLAGWDKLDWTQKVQQVREAEGVINAQLAQQRGDMERQVREAVAVSLTGQQYPGADKWNEGTFTGLFGEQGRQMWQQFQYAQQVGWTMHNFKNMSAAQVSQWLEQNKPQPGPNFTEQNAMYQKAQVAATSIASRISQSPAQYAADTGMVKELQNPTDPKELAQVLRAREGVINNLRMHWGAKREIFTPDEVNRLQTTMESSNSRTILGLLGGLRSSFVDPANYHAAIAQLSAKNPTIGYAGDLITKSGLVNGEDSRTIARKILDGSAALGGKDLADPANGNKRPFQINDSKFHNFFTAVAGNAFMTPDGKQSAAYAQQVYENVRAYAVGDAVQKGKNPGQITQSDVSNAFSAVTGGISTSWRGDRLIMPWGVAPQQFNAAFPHAVSSAIVSAGLKGTALDKADAYHFVNMGGGRYMGMNGGKPIIGPKGAVVVDLSHLAPHAGHLAAVPGAATSWTFAPGNAPNVMSVR